MTGIGSKNITLNIPVNWLWGVVTLGAALILGFIVIRSDWRPILVFTAAVVAGCAGLITALNNVDQRAAAATKADEQAKAARVAAALEVFYRWSDPTFFHCKLAGREIMEHFKVTTRVEDQIAYLKQDVRRYANLVDMLNTFEGLAIAIDNDVVDDKTARRFFRGIILEYWHMSEDVIRKNRAEGNNPRLWKEFESLYARWKD